MRLAIAAASLLLAGIGFVAAVVFLCIALYSEFLTFTDPPLAALATAFAALLFSGIVVLIGQMLMRGRGGFSRDPAMELGRRLGEQAHDFLNTNKRTAILASLAAGFAVGASPRLRKILRDLIGS